MMLILRNFILLGFECFIDEGYFVIKKGFGIYVILVIFDEVI